MKECAVGVLVKKVDDRRIRRRYLQKEYEESQRHVFQEPTNEECNHDVIVYLSTEYKSGDLMDPDYYSTYRCAECGCNVNGGTRVYDLENPVIDMHMWEKEKFYTDDEKFAIFEYRLRELAERHPEYTTMEAIEILNEEFAK